MSMIRMLKSVSSLTVKYFPEFGSQYKALHYVGTESSRWMEQRQPGSVWQGERGEQDQVRWRDQSSLSTLATSEDGDSRQVRTRRDTMRIMFWYFSSTGSTTLSARSWLRWDWRAQVQVQNLNRKNENSSNSSSSAFIYLELSNYQPKIMVFTTFINLY